MSGLPLFTQWLAEEADAASEVKKDFPVMVVLGNPPYSGHSANKGEWIRGLINDYKEGCPELKKPAQAKWLSDDYVKFIRFAQWRIEKTGFGILAFISNHAYLDNPTFRGMRQSLMRSFDDIYFLDLHGNAKKKERCPDGSKDENVFDIQQGVAIGIFVKRLPVGSSPPLEKEGRGDLPHPANVRHADLYGLREAKYKWLGRADLKATKWEALKPQPPHYLFIPQATELLPEYEAGWKIPDIFSPNGDPAPGIVTTHDEFAISWSPSEAVRKVERLLATNTEAEARELFRLCTQSQWQYERAKIELKDGLWRKEVTELLYRPFDKRWTVFNRNVAVHRRERVMRQMLERKNIALITSRLTKGETFKHVQVTRNIVEVICMSPKTSNNGFVFPLYLYPVEKEDSLLSSDRHTGSSGGRRANLSPDFISEFAGRLKLDFVSDGKGDLEKTFGPEDVFDYIYAVFHSPAYRSRYVEFLKGDFPRLPLTSNTKLFRELCALGGELVALHLMEKYGPELTTYPVKGDDQVEAVRYTEPGQGAKKGRVWINKTQYFEGITPEVWNFQIGGYQVCHKWLKDRKGRKLEYDDVQHYQRIVSALSETIRLMAEIDKAIIKHSGWPFS